MLSWRGAWKPLLVLVSIAMFVVALKLMQAGARTFAPLIEEHVEVETPVGALGFGWAAAYVLLSGSPVAAAALAFFEAREIDELAAFAMITGSRLGAAFIVLVLGLFYVFYRRHSLQELRIGLLALIVTASVYLPAFVVGYGALEAGALEVLGEGRSRLGEALEDGPVKQIEEAAEELFPPWGLFLAGLALIMASLKLFDLSLPALDAENGKLAGIRRYLDRRWPMFGLGAGITLVSLSVTVSLGLLVPLHERRIVRTSQVVPYILGANITTFADTLLAAITMKRAEGMAIVVLEMGTVLVISLLILCFAYERYARAALGAVDWITARRRNLALSGAVLIGLPAVLLLLPRLAPS